MGMDTPWPLPDVLAKLIQATDHLLNAHMCDTHGHEEFRAATMRAQEYLSEMRRSAVETSGEPRLSTMYVSRICTAYESGFGRGLSKRDVSQPYASGTPEALAYFEGYTRAVAKTVESRFYRKDFTVETNKDGRCRYWLSGEHKFEENLSTTCRCGAVNGS